MNKKLLFELKRDIQLKLKETKTPVPESLCEFKATLNSLLAGEIEAVHRSILNEVFKGPFLDRNLNQLKTGDYVYYNELSRDARKAVGRIIVEGDDLKVTNVADGSPLCVEKQTVEAGIRVSNLVKILGAG